MRLLDRYVLRSFFVPFAYCFIGFLAIWLVFELNDDGRDFMEAKVPFLDVAAYYATQAPAIAMVCLPVAILLALLFSLGRMSRSNEIIAMVTAGVSISRILLPLLGVGLLATAVAFALSYQAAPSAEQFRVEAMEKLIKGRAKSEALGGQMFRNRTDRRLWYVRSMNLQRGDLTDVHIIQEDPSGAIVERYYVREADYDDKRHTWRFRRGLLTRYDGKGNIVGRDDWLKGDREITGWTETPYRIASATLDPAALGVPDLREYLDENADFPPAQLAPYRTYLAYRWAVPWQCFIAVIIAAPLGIVFTRRGILAGVAGSIFIFFGVIFLEKLCLTLGKGGRLPPGAAAWIPNALFLSIGLLLLWMKSGGREWPALLRFGRRR
jgi:LPS export ABC transporter permease LptG